jgi:glycosyltransferase involved in cell wall biosynthesis
LFRPVGISVVIPSYERVDFLIEAIESVVTLHPDQVEIIIVDDASPTDPTSLLPHKNSSGVVVRLFRLSSNSGPQTARNLGIRRARFTHVSLLDSDDLFMPLKMDRLLNTISESAPDIIFHEIEGLDKYNCLARVWHRYVHILIPFHWFIMLYNPVPTPALTFRRRIALGPPGWRHCEDYAFLLNYCRVDYNVCFLPEKLSRVRRNIGTIGGLSAALWTMRKGEFRARRLLLRKNASGNVGRFVLGTVFGSLRLLKDVVSMRYWKA